MQLLSSLPEETGQCLKLENHVDVMDLDLTGIERIQLDFPKFTDGRAYSQAVMLRRRCGFKYDLQATGDVLVDQLVMMRRCGFSSAVLRADQSIDLGQRLLGQALQTPYQGDLIEPRAWFARPAAAQAQGV